MVISNGFTNHSHVMGAVWSLHESVTLNDATDFTKELLISKMGSNLLDVHVFQKEISVAKHHQIVIVKRSCIGFKYRMETPGEGAHAQYFYVFREMFQKRFGTKLIGWSVTSPIHVLLHVEMTQF